MSHCMTWLDTNHNIIDTIIPMSAYQCTIQDTDRVERIHTV